VTSRFPGIDPFIERLKWPDFHTVFNTVLRQYLLERLGPRYYVALETRVYSELLTPDTDLEIVPDSSVHLENHRTEFAGPASDATAASPIACLVPCAAEQRERYLAIQDVATKTVVAVIETLSPFNKRPGKKGYRTYVKKRDAVMRSKTHLVEFDFLRGGRRMPVAGLPVGAFYALISRSYLRPAAEGYAWSLFDPLPNVAIPLLREDADVVVSLSQVYALAYASGQYPRVLDYTAALKPPCSEEERRRLDELLAK
jgi:hypothetical protein